MVKLTDYGTLQAYVDATLATDGAPKRSLESTIAAEDRAVARAEKRKYGEEGRMQTPQTPQTPQKKPKQNRKKGQ